MEPGCGRAVVCRKEEECEDGSWQAVFRLQDSTSGLATPLQVSPLLPHHLNRYTLLRVEEYTAGN